MTDSWPIAYLRPAKVTRHIAPRTTAGTVSASGFTQRVSVPAHAWVISYDGITIGTDEQLRVWDYIAAQLDGGATPILVPLIGEGNGGATNATVTSGANAGDTLITLTRVGVPALAGYHFTIGEHLYRIATVNTVVGDDYGITIRPPLRQDIFAAWAASFSAPVCKCRLATDDEMLLELDAARIGVGKIKFVEDPEISV